MKFKLEDIKKSLEEYKDAILSKVKESETGTVEKMTELEKKLDEKLEKQMDEWKKRKLSLPGLEDEPETKNFNFANVVNAQLNPKGFDGVPNSDFERAVIEETAKKYEARSNNAGSGEAGGYLVPDEVSSIIIDLAMANTPVMEMGPTMLRGLRGELPIPKITGRPTMYWVGEEEAATESSTTFGEIVLRPKTAAGFTKISRRLLHQSAGVADTIVRQELVKSFRLGIDQALLEGKGSEKSIKGVRYYDNLTSTTSLGTNGNRFRIDKAAEMQMNIDVANMLMVT